MFCTWQVRKFLGFCGPLKTFDPLLIRCFSATTIRSLAKLLMHCLHIKLHVNTIETTKSGFDSLTQRPPAAHFSPAIICQDEYVAMDQKTAQTEPTGLDIEAKQHQTLIKKYIYRVTFWFTFKRPKWFFIAFDLNVKLKINS